MTKKGITTLVLLLIVLVGIGYYIFKKNIGTVNIPSSANMETEGNVQTEGTAEAASLPGLKLPAGFSISIFAKDVPNARVIAIDPKGRIVVSEPAEGKIVALSDANGDYVSDQNERKVLATDLNRPHGMAFDCDNAAEQCFLYVAENDALLRFPYDATTPSLGKEEKLISIGSLPNNHHFTRSLLFLPSPNEDTLLISVGSSCNVCHEKHPDNATILSYNIKTGKKETYAKGLRNAPFMAHNPADGKVYATEMGRDNLGDDLPPDEINIISKGKNYGWPICYGKNIHDTQFDKNTYIRNPCMEPLETQSLIDLQAHSAPLGLAFIPESWPEDYQNNLLVAYHGSWNRSIPTGYKIVRIKMDGKGNYLGTEDFITGWLTSSGTKIGRPVDIKVLPGGVAYISDDSSGVIYRLKKL